MSESYTGGMRIPAFLIGLLALTVSALADEPARLVTREYPIEELLFSVPDFDNKTPARSAAQQQLDLMRKRSDATKRLVSAVSLIVSEETNASVTSLPKSLRVIASEEDHRRIAHVLESVRREQLSQISLEVRFVLVNRNFGRTLPANLRDHIARVKAGTNVSSIMSADETDKLIRSFESQRDVSVLTAPRMTLFNGQRGEVLVATDTMYVADLHPRTRADGTVEYEPETKIATPGVKVVARLCLNEDRSSVAVTLNADMYRMLSMKTVRWPQSPAGQNLVIQVPELDHVSADCLLNIVNGQCALLRPTRTGNEVDDGLEPFILVKSTVLPLQKPL